MSDLEQMSLKELQAEVVKLGMSEENAATFTTKNPLIATINTLKASVRPAVKIDEVAENKQIEKQYRKDALIMRDSLLKQPKMSYFIPLEGKGEKKGVVKWVVNPKTKLEEQVQVSGTVHPVTLNGFVWLVPKGVRTQVPEQVAEVLDERFNQTSEVEEENLLSRPNETVPGVKEGVGSTVAEVLL